jgi:nitrate reductase gamma subunit
MWKTVKPNDLLALVLLWALVVIGCLIGDVRPAHKEASAVCPPALEKTSAGPGGG